MQVEQGRKVVDVPWAHLGRQGDQRRPVIQSAAVADIASLQFEEIAAQDFQCIDLPAQVTGFPGDEGRKSVFGKERFHRDGADFDTYHLESLFQQPEHVPAFTAQGDKDTLSPGPPQGGPVTNKIGVDIVLMKTDMPGFPALMPEVRIHGIN